MPKTVAEPGQGVQITIRTTLTVVQRAEDLVAFIAEDQGRPAVRADVFREVFLEGLEAVERRRDKKKRTR